MLPPLAFWVTKRICLSLQRHDRDKVLHGRETGTIIRTADGQFFEEHEPLDEYERWTLVQHEAPGAAGARAAGRRERRRRQARPLGAAPGPAVAASTSRTASRRSPRPSWPPPTTTVEHEAISSPETSGSLEGPPETQGLGLPMSERESVKRAPEKDL